MTFFDSHPEKFVTAGLFPVEVKSLDNLQIYEDKEVKETKRIIRRNQIRALC